MLELDVDLGIGVDQALDVVQGAKIAALAGVVIRTKTSTEKAAETTRKDLAPDGDEMALGILSRGGRSGEELRFFLADLERGIVGVKFFRLVPQKVNGTIIREIGEIGKIIWFWIGWKVFMEPDLEFRMIGRVPVGQFARDLTRRRVDRIKRLRDDTSLKIDQAAPDLEHGASRKGIQIDIAEIGESQVAVDVRKDGHGDKAGTREDRKYRFEEVHEKDGSGLEAAV